MTITIKTLSTGWVHIRGLGPCNWAQPPHWPCSMEVLRDHAFPEASSEFLSACIKATEQGERLRAAASTFTVDIGSLPKRKPKFVFPEPMTEDSHAD